MNINYTFKDESLLQLALTQSGINAVNNNERLEFIGDRVLGLSVAELLYKMYPEANEGGLARRHATLVSTETLAQVAKTLDIAKHVRHGHMTCDKIDHILANAVEAILGAIFLDSNFDTVKQ
ncbi:MAG: ribonuclease III, partial [Alphaproteobacteria bacterium]|nr:ribonuclease III [Alphaproteobacteria bacterium]